MFRADVTLSGKRTLTDSGPFQQVHEMVVFRCVV